MQGFKPYVSQKHKNMIQLKAHIECNKSGYYSVYAEDGLPFGVIGEGETAEQAKQDFLNVFEAMRQAHKERTNEYVEAEFDFVLDASAFLQQYKGVLTLSGLSRITGVNKAQLSHYVTGVRRPSPRTQEKIKESVLLFANQMSRAFI